jgi:hypothetical protein
MTKMQKKSLDSPEETRSFDKGKVELANLGDITIGRATLEPGWSWEKCVKRCHFTILTLLYMPNNYTITITIGWSC